MFQRTCDDTEVGEQRARKKIKGNTRYAKQIKKKVIFLIKDSGEGGGW